MSDEAKVVSKVEELMKALDQVKRYRALSRLMIDFAVIMLLSIAVLLAWELGVDFYKLGNALGCYYMLLGQYTCTASVGLASQPLQLLAGLGILVIPAAGLLAGVFWVDRKLKGVKVGEWKALLSQGFPGALKLLQDLKWDSVFEDIRASKIGYSVYFAVKVIGYWILSFVILLYPYAFGLSALHLDANLYTLALLSLVLVLVLSRGDLQRKYRQVISLDNLMWELRWFSSGFKPANFEA
jgi:hypothetical protein